MSHKIRAQLGMGGQGTSVQGVPGLILGEIPLLMSVSNESRLERKIVKKC